MRQGLLGEQQQGERRRGGGGRRGWIEGGGVQNVLPHPVRQGVEDHASLFAPHGSRDRLGSLRSVGGRGGERPVKLILTSQH